MDNTLTCSICFGPFPFPQPEASEGRPEDAEKGVAPDGRSVHQSVGQKVTTVFPCGHQFHYDCIRKWADRLITCPIDRRLIIGTDPSIPVPETLPEQLCTAASDGNLKLVNFLLTLGVDVNAVNSTQESPLFCAIQYQHLDVAISMINHGANIKGYELELGELYERHWRYKEAFRYYQLSAEQGEPEGYNNLGRMYELSLGCEQNFQEAFKYYQRSALMDDPEGCTSLGRAYEIALGTDRNLPEAIRCYQRAANLGYADGLNNLGRMHEEIGQTAEALKEAFNYYLLSAEQGDPDGLYRLGRMYEYGFGIGRDLKEAFRYYQLSAGQGDIDGEQSLQRMNAMYRTDEFATAGDYNQ